jgi:hypothetical protein
MVNEMIMASTANEKNTATIPSLNVGLSIETSINELFKIMMKRLIAYLISELDRQAIEYLEIWKCSERWNMTRQEQLVQFD